MIACRRIDQPTIFGSGMKQGGISMAETIVGSSDGNVCAKILKFIAQAGLQ